MVWNIGRLPGDVKLFSDFPQEHFLRADNSGMWWQLEVIASLVISLAYFAISYAILAPLVREKQLRANRLGVATAGIFFSCAVGHGIHGLHPLLYTLGDRSSLAVAGRVIPAHEAIWDAVTAMIGAYYWTLRRTYGALMRGASLFADLEHQRLAQELQSQAAVQEAYDLFSGVLDAATEQSIIGIDLDGRVTVFNVGAQRMLGYSEQQMLGRVPDDLYDRAEIAACAAELGVDPSPAVITLALGDRSSDTRQWTYLTGDGRRLEVMLTVTATRGSAGEVTGYITVGTDVTEQRQAEKVLRDERRRLREAQVIGHTGSWERDLRTDTVTRSDTLCDLYGISRKSGAHGNSRALDNNVHPDDAPMIRDAMDACITTGAPMRLRYRLTRQSDGEMRWFEVSGEAFYQDGRCVRIGGAVQDVTEQVTAATDLEAARDLALEASRQKSAFLATMSHEIRTPMNAVIGMTGLLLSTPLDVEQREFVETVRTSGDALLGIINDILDFSKIEAGGLELEHRLFDLRSCVEESLELIGAMPGAKGLELIGHLDARCPTQVVGDVTRLRQILVNLLGNAIKFTARGEVVLTVEPDAFCGELGLRFAVADTGIGIPLDRLASLFDSFSQVDASTTRIYGGTGLGLAISQRLVKAMGGDLGVESTSGVGSTFAFSIALDRPAVELTDPATDSMAPLKGRSVLVVDDNPTNRRILRLQLEAWGLRVTEAASGDAAIAVVASDTHFDVAVVDMKMPGMTGHELAVVLHSAPETASLPLVLLSSVGDRRASQYLELFSAVLTKPVRSARLHQGLRTALLQEEVPLLDIPETVGASRGSGGLRVLLAEDNAVNQRVARLMLEKLGHHVDVVGNGREATEAVRLVPYDVVLMDVEMPEMDGLEATRVIRRDLPAHRQTQIVAMTASALVEDRHACTDAGMNDYLAKPVRIEDLDAALTKAAAGPSYGAISTLTRPGD